MNQGKFIFSQVMEFIPRYQFDKIVKRYKGDWHTKNLNSYNHLLHLLFGQLTGCDSLRDICLCLEAHSRMLYHLGFRKSVSHTSLSRANENRDYRIFEGLGCLLMEQVRTLYSNAKLSDITMDNVIYALDSTTISTSIKLAAWALGKYGKGAVKMHTLLDLRGGIPANIHITDGKWHDSNELDRLSPEPYAFYVMDKAYVDFRALFVSSGQVVLGIPTQGEHEIRHHQTDGDHGFEITDIGGLAYQAYRLQVKQALSRQYAFHTRVRPG